MSEVTFDRTVFKESQEPLFSGCGKHPEYRPYYEISKKKCFKIKPVGEFVYGENPLKLIVPNIDLIGCTKDKPIYLPYKRYSFQRAIEWSYFFLHLACKSAISSDRNDFTCRLSGKVLSTYNRNYHYYLEWLQWNLILIRDHHYVVGKESKSYTLFNDIIIKKGWKEIQIENKVIKKLLEEQNKEDKEGLYKWFNSKLTVDCSLVDKVVKEAKENRVNDYRRNIYAKFGKSADRGIFQYHLNTKMIQIEYRIKSSINNINRGRYSFKPNEHFGRLYTTVSGMPKEARKLLRYDDKELVTVDMSNAIPFLALAFFQKTSFEKLEMESLIAEYNPVLFNNKIKRRALSVLLRLCHSGDKESEIGHYKSLVVNGTFYNFMMDKLSASQLKHDKNRFKEEFYLSIFNKNSYKSETKSIFEDHFPTISRVFELVKFGFDKTRTEGRLPYEQSNALCLILYRIESQIMVQDVPNRFHEHWEGIPLYTIHDGIMTLSNYKDILIARIEIEIEKIYGCSPKVELE